jgi:hypothetical protein
MINDSNHTYRQVGTYLVVSKVRRHIGIARKYQQSLTLVLPYVLATIDPRVGDAVVMQSPRCFDGGEEHPQVQSRS